jgi:GNAT superfamily N-acetyltransferase
MKIRPGRPSEANALSALAFAAKASWGYPDAWMREWAPQLRFMPDLFDRCLVLVAEVDQVPRGVIAVSWDTVAGTGEIEHLWVDPGSQGTGLGRALVDEAIDHARRAGVASLRIESDPGARSFYERLGARHEGEVPSPVLGIPRTLPVLRLQVGDGDLAGGPLSATP